MQCQYGGINFLQGYHKMAILASIAYLQEFQKCILTSESFFVKLQTPNECLNHQFYWIFRWMSVVYNCTFSGSMCACMSTR